MPDLFEGGGGSYGEGDFGGDFFSVDEEGNCEGWVCRYYFGFRHSFLMASGLFVRDLKKECRFLMTSALYMKHEDRGPRLAVVYTVLEM